MKDDKVEIVISTLDLINKSIKLNDEVDQNDVSDGYHTFGELYKHRIHLFIALMKSQLRLAKANFNLDFTVIKSKLHDDGSEFEGWFIVQFELTNCKDTQISYHLPNEYWDKCSFIDTVEKAYPWDGHTSDDVLDRLLKI